MHTCGFLPALQTSAATPITFPSLASYIQFTATSSTGIQAQMEFRTHDRDGLLIYHPMSTDGSGLKVNVS